jgi:hypothetical protein
LRNINNNKGRVDVVRSKRDDEVKELKNNEEKNTGHTTGVRPCGIELQTPTERHP